MGNTCEKSQPATYSYLDENNCSRDTNDRFTLTGVPNPEKFLAKNKKKMVGWYAKHLFSTALDLLVSTKLSTSHDVRVLGALLNSHVHYEDMSELVVNGKTPKKNEGEEEKEKKEMWLDFLADTGDGFDSSYSVVYKLTRPKLTFGKPSEVCGSSDSTTNEIIEADMASCVGKEGYEGSDVYSEKFDLPRGEALLLGGDLAYPVPTSETYNYRFKKLFEMSIPWCDRRMKGTGYLLNGHLRCYAIPGNHDWYDSLNHFNSTFIRGRSADILGMVLEPDLEDKGAFSSYSWLGGYHIGQGWSYYALKLPKDWWIFGLDFGLENDIDYKQLHYFLKVSEQIKPTGANPPNIILTCHEPIWLERDFKKNPTNVTKLLRKIKNDGQQVRLWLAGDLHNYRRDSDKDGNLHKIIAGGGGAFMHPTWTGFASNTEHKDDDIELKREKVYPSAAISYLLAFKNLLFPLYNPFFGFVTMAFYSTILWWVQCESNLASPSFFQALSTYSFPSAYFLMGSLGLFCLYFAEGRWWAKIPKGGVHSALHFGAISLLYWAARAANSYFHVAAAKTLSAMGIYLSGGYILGSLVMGIYLLGSALCGFHFNEAYSSLQIEEYKNFVRLHLTQDGDLEVYAIGIDKPNHSWKCAKASEDSYKSPLVLPTKSYSHKIIDYIKIKQKWVDLDRTVSVN